jgi:hypothetical protein
MAMIALWLGATLATSLVATGGASAAHPEFGRCTPQSKGKYTDAGCTKPARPGKGVFEWQAGPGLHPNFTTEVEKGTLVTLEDVRRHKMTCTGGSGEGSYSQEKTVEIRDLEFTGCKEPGATGCTNGGPGEVSIGPLDGNLGIIKKGAKDTIGLALKGSSGEVIREWECEVGGVMERVALLGGVIREEPAYKMLNALALRYRATKGHQMPEKFEGLPKEVLFTSRESKTPLQTGLTLSLRQMNEERIEVR